MNRLIRFRRFCQLGRVRYFKLFHNQTNLKAGVLNGED